MKVKVKIIVNDEEIGGAIGFGLHGQHIVDLKVLQVINEEFHTEFFCEGVLEPKLLIVSSEGFQLVDP